MVLQLLFPQNVFFFNDAKKIIEKVPDSIST